MIEHALIAAAFILIAAALVWASSPAISKTMKRAAARSAERSALDREDRDRQRLSRAAAEERLRTMRATEEERLSERAKRSPLDFIRAFMCRNLQATVSIEGAVELATGRLAQANSDLDALTAELPDQQPPTVRDYVVQSIATASWVVLALVQGGLVAWVLFALTGNLMVTLLGTVVIVAVLEAPGLLLGVLRSKRLGGRIEEGAMRLGMIALGLAMAVFIAVMAFMAGYRAEVVNQPEVTRARASQIVAQEDNDSYTLAVAREVEAQAADKIRRESIIFGVIEGGVCVFETLLALFIPSFFVSRAFRRRAAAQRAASDGLDAAELQKGAYYALKESELAQEFVIHGLDLSLLELIRRDGRLVLFPDTLDLNIAIGDYKNLESEEQVPC
ncbi:MAG: hypothetical protein LBD25_03425 [Coriobacteriales bacterium]|jgi:hypothetical protein|nr:hypothetical protein [Coriobacteriales bacterium]